MEFPDHLLPNHRLCASMRGQWHVPAVGTPAAAAAPAAKEESEEEEDDNM